MGEDRRKAYNKNNKNGNKIISLLNNLEYSLYDIGNYMKKIENKDDFFASFISERAQTDILCLPKNNF